MRRPMDSLISSALGTVFVLVGIGWSLLSHDIERFMQCMAIGVLLHILAELEHINEKLRG